MNRYLDYYLDLVEAHHRLIVLFTLIITVSMGYGISSITVTNDFRVYFSDNNPQLKSFNNMQDRFGSDDGLFIYIAPKNKQIFSLPALKLVEQLTEQVWTIPHSTRVRSIQNHPYIRVTDDDIYSDPMYSDDDLQSKEKLLPLKNKMIVDPSLRNSLIDSKGQATGIHVGLTFPVGDIESSVEAVMYTRKLLKTFRNQSPDIEIRLAGNTYGNVVLGEYGQH